MRRYPSEQEDACQRKYHFQWNPERQSASSPRKMEIIAGGASFAAQTVVISSSWQRRYAEQICRRSSTALIDSQQEEQELCVLQPAYVRAPAGLRRCWSIMDQLLCLPEPLIPVEGFFMEQAYQTVFVSHTFHDFHRQLVVDQLQHLP